MKGGAGGGGLPKQFLLLGNELVVMRTGRNLYQALEQARKDIEVDMGAGRRMGVDSFVHEMLIALPEKYVDRWEAWCREYRFEVPHRVVAGGRTRAETVARALAEVDVQGADIQVVQSTEMAKGADYVLIHDGVRPFVTAELVTELWKTVVRAGTAVPVVPVVDSLRRVDDGLQRQQAGSSQVVDRAAYRAVQTPQLFRADLIRRAYAVASSSNARLTRELQRFTDDASLVERVTGSRIALVEGDPANTKITTPEDLSFARWRVENNPETCFEK